jgi:hypothetical protein
MPPYRKVTLHNDGAWGHLIGNTQSCVEHGALHFVSTDPLSGIQQCHSERHYEEQHDECQVELDLTDA